MDEDADEDTRLAVAQALEIDHQYLERIDARDQERVDQLRRIGRSVARELGWRVRTGTVDLEGDRLLVWIVIIKSTPEDADRLESRTALLLERMFLEE